MAIAAATIAVSSTLVVAPPNVNVSRLDGPQNEPTIAIDPSDDRILLAGSNSFTEGTMRSYSSTDGGSTWEVGTEIGRAHV